MNATELGNPRVARVVHEGLSYYPILRHDGALGPEAVDELAKRSGPAALRRFRAIVADEALPRDGKLALSLSTFRPTRALPLTYGDSVYTIGCLEDLVVLPTVDGAEGAALVGIGRLYANALAAIVWPAIVSRMLTGLCAEVIGSESDGRLVVRDITRVTLGGVENNCLPGAIVLDAWESVEV
jgi:hypothetical protein